MNPTLKAYLDKLHAETRAQYAEIHKQLQLQEALFSKFDTGASIPQPAHSPVVASDGGLSIDAADAAVLPEASSPTTKAQEALEVIHDASPGYITMAPITCSMECSTQVDAITSVDEVQDAVTTVYPEHVVNLSLLRYSLHSVVDTFPTYAALLCNHTKDNLAYVSSREEMMFEELRWQPWPPPVQVQIRSKRSMSRPCPWPSFDCFHESTHLKYTWPKITYAMHHFAGALNPLTESSRCRPSVHLKLLCSSFSSNCQAVQLWSELPKVEFQSSAPGSIGPNLMRESWWYLQPKITYKIRHMGHLFRPRPWPWFTYQMDAGYPDEPYSGIHNPPHDVSWSSAGLALFLFRDKDFIPVCCGELIPMEEPFICLLQCETSYAFYWEMLALAVELFSEHLLLLQPKPPWSALALTKIATYDSSTSNFGFHLVGTCLIVIKLKLCTDLISYRINPGLHPLCMSTSRALVVLMCDWPLSSERELIAGAMAISTEKLLQSLSIQCNFEFGSTQAYLKPNEVCAAPVYLFEDYASIWSELHIVVQGQVQQWAWCFYLEKSWSIRYLACKSQERGKIYVVGGIPIPDKLQETVQIMTVSIQRQFLSQDTFKWSGHFASYISFALGRAMLTSFYIDSSKRSSKQFGDLLVRQTCLMVKHTVSLQPWSSNTKVPCFTCFASRSRHLSRLHFHAYQNGNSFRMSWDPVNHIMSNLEKPFSCFQGTQLQSWRPPDRTLSCAIQSSREEAIHWEQVHYKDLQFYPYSLEHPLEGDEIFIPYQTAYGFDLEMMELVSNMWKSDHGWVVRLYLVQRHYMLLGILCSTPDCTLHVSIKSWFEQQKGRSYNLLVVAELTLCPMHMRILQAVEIFRELTSAITTESYSSDGSFVHSDRVRKRGVQHNNTVEGNKIKSNCSLCSDTHLVGIRLLLIELESCILVDSESTQYACIAWMSHEFESSRPATHPVHEFSSIVSRASTVQWVARKHLPLFNPKPPWPIPVPPSFLPEFRGNRRTSSELVHLTEVLVELTHFWAFVYPISTSPNHWWCFYWGTPAAYLIFALDWFGYNNKASQQEEISWNSGSPPTGYILHDHCCRYPCGIAEELNSRRVQSTERSNEHRTIQSVLLAISSCAQWDPGGLDFADIQSLQIPCSMPRLAGCTSHRLRLVFTEKHSYESVENGHRLGGKPVVKEEGMSATQLLPWPHRPTSPPRATSTWAGPIEN